MLIWSREDKKKSPLPVCLAQLGRWFCRHQPTELHNSPVRRVDYVIVSFQSIQKKRDFGHLSNENFLFRVRLVIPNEASPISVSDNYTAPQDRPAALTDQQNWWRSNKTSREHCIEQKKELKSGFIKSYVGRSTLFLA